MIDQLLDTVERLAAKTAVMQMVLHSLVVETLLQTDDPVAQMRDFAKRVETALTKNDPTNGGRPSMLIEMEVAEQFGLVEQRLREEGAE